MKRYQFFDQQNKLQNEAIFENQADLDVFILENGYQSLTKVEIDEVAYQDELAQDLEDEKFGEHRQRGGKQVIAKINGTNKRKLKSGTWDAAKFQALITDPSIQAIERSLFNGSLETALGLINALDNTFYTNQEKNKIIKKIQSILAKD